MPDSHKTSPEHVAPRGSSPADASDLRAGKLALLLLACILFGAMLAFGLGVSAGFATQPLAAKAAVLAAVSILIGAAHGLFVLVLAARQAIERLPMLIVASGVIRMFVALAVGLTLYLILTPEGKTFWAAFLIGGLLSLLVETAWGLSAVRRLFPATPASPSPESGAHA